MLPSVVALPTTSTPTLVRSIRPWDLVGVVINGVIGAGIFGLPSKVFALAGNYSLISFILCAVCVALIVLSFAEVGSRFSATGGPYLFARETYGPLTGFTVGWLVWIARITSFSANINLLPAYLGFFFPAVATGLPRAVILTAIVVLLAVLNVRGVRKVADASNVFAMGKLLVFLIFIVVGLFFIVPGRFVLAAAPDYRSFSQTVLLLVYAFTGFEMALIPAGEIRNPERILPWALLVGMSIVVAADIAIQVVCIGTLPGLAASQRPLADAAATFLGNGGAVMITAGIVFSLSGNLNVLILSASRVMFAMAEHGQLPRPSLLSIPGSALPPCRPGFERRHPGPDSVRHIHLPGRDQHHLAPGHLHDPVQRPTRTTPPPGRSQGDFSRPRGQSGRDRRDIGVRVDALQ